MQMYFVNLHDSNGGWIPFSKFVAAFSEELQKRKDPLKTTTIDFPLNRKLFCELPEEQIVAELSQDFSQIQIKVSKNHSD